MNAPPPPFVGPLPARYTLDQLRALATSAGFPDANTAAAVAMAESGGDPAAAGDVVDGKATSLGLWQIHVPAHPEVDASRLGDPGYSASQAFAISKAGTDWSPWSTFTSGAYAQYMPGAPPRRAAGVLAGVPGWAVLLVVVLLARRKR